MTKEKRSMGASETKSKASTKVKSSSAAGISTSASTNAAGGGDDDSEGEADNDEDDPLMASIKRSNDAFTSLLSLIPAQYYLAPDSEDSSEIFDIKLSIKNKRKQEKAQESAEKKAASKEAKRARLDPDNFRSAADIQKEKAAAKKPSIDDQKIRLSLDEGILTGARAGDTDSEGESGDNDDDDDDDDNGSAETQITSVKGSDDAGEKPAANGHSGILDLRARLQAKIQSMQAQRKMVVNGGEAGDDDESVASTKDELLEERRRKRGEMRDKRRRAMKERRKAEKIQGKESNNSGNNKKGGKAPTLLVPERSTLPSSSSQGHGHSAPLSNLAFSSIQFGDDQDVHKGKKNRHELPSDPKAALAILEARKKKEEDRAAKQRKVEEVEVNKSEKGALDIDRKERDRWSKAEAAAQGIKIRDDESLLKKAAKKKDKIKEKSRKEWNDRDRETKDQAAARQKKRDDNLAARKASSKSKGKKMGGGKKPKARAGFEGTSRHSKLNGKLKNKSHK